MRQKLAGVSKISGFFTNFRPLSFSLTLAAASLLGSQAGFAKTLHHERPNPALENLHHLASLEVTGHHHAAYHHASTLHVGYASTAVRRQQHYAHVEDAALYVTPQAGAGHYRRHRRLHMAVAHYRHSYLQCVPYAREVSHVALTGNAFLWWAEAAGRYARGSVPQEGAVLNFRAIGRMPLGHVAVVTSVLDSRTILVTQANWIPGTITNDVTVEDVSDNNDWSQVEVELGDSAKWGAPYPTYGFIYNQPDNGVTIASTPATTTGTELAEAPSAPAVQSDAPDRNLQ
jgi:surface antigen